MLYIEHEMIVSQIYHTIYCGDIQGRFYGKVRQYILLFSVGYGGGNKYNSLTNENENYGWCSIKKNCYQIRPTFFPENST